MQLTVEQVAQYGRDGLAHFTGLFDAAEIAALKAEQARILPQRDAEIFDADRVDLVAV